MAISKNQLLFNFLVRVLPYLVIYFISLVLCDSRINALLTMPTMIIISANLLMLRVRFVSIPEVILFVTYLAFVIRPLQVVSGNAFIGTTVGYNRYTDDQFLITHACAWIFLLVCSFYFSIWRSKNIKEYRLSTFSGLEIILLCISIASFLIYMAGMGGLSNVLAPRFEKMKVLDAPWLTFFRAMQMTATAVLFIMAKDKGWRYAPCAIASFFILIMSANPFNTSRFSLLAAYIPLALIWLRGRVSAQNFMIAAGVFTVILMPILNATTRGGGAAADNSSMNESIFVIKFVDVFDMTVENVSYSSVFGYTYGQKLIGDALFFIPRAVWTSKPSLNALDVGGRLVDLDIAGTDNLSMPVFADGFRDFHLIGALFGSVFFLHIIYLGAFWRPVIVDGFPISGFIVFASIPIVFRGPFSSTVPLVFFQIVSLFFLSLILKRLSVKYTSGKAQLLSVRPKSVGQSPAEEMNK